jgi:hypothetical protein
MPGTGVATKGSNRNGSVSAVDRVDPLLAFFDRGLDPGPEGMNSDDIAVHLSQDQGHSEDGELLDSRQETQAEAEEAIESTDPDLRPLGIGNHALLNLLRSESSSPCPDGGGSLLDDASSQQFTIGMARLWHSPCIGSILKRCSAL